MIEKYIPRYKVEEVLADADNDGMFENADLRYLAFPSILEVDSSTLLISYRRGKMHAWSRGITELIRYNTAKKCVISRETLDVPEEGHNINTELARMPNGDIVCFIDNQRIQSEVSRIGIKQLRSSDNGKTWTGTKRLIDDSGIEYGYVYDSLIVGGEIYLLALTFPELQNQGSGRYVHVIKSSDNGITWKHVKNLKDAFGFSCDDECSFEQYGEGFFMVIRGRDCITRAVLTDREFNLIKIRNLTQESECIHHLCRPEVFIEDGKYYVLGRDVLMDKNMDIQEKKKAELILYPFSPEKLEPTGYICLDVKEAGSPANCYYAEHYMKIQGEKKFLNVITYSDKNSANPDIVRLEYDWAELVSQKKFRWNKT